MNPSSDRGARAWIGFAAFAYVIAVLVIDTLSTQRAQFVFDWGDLRTSFYGAEPYKFIAWFIVPFHLCLPRMDWGYLTFARWKRIDWAILAGVTLVGAGIMLVLPWLPGVGDLYRGWGARALDHRIELAGRQILWTLSWLTGWEFMHRYLLPRAALHAWPVRGPVVALIAIPLIEALYHVVQGKPHIESLGMGLLSLAFTAWVLHRRNALLPFLGHLIIELELIAFLFVSQ